MNAPLWNDLIGIEPETATTELPANQANDAEAVAARRVRRNRAVAIALGLLLLTAAGLKLYGLGVSAVPRIGWLLTPWMQMLVVEWEIILGAWLLSGKYRVGAWLAAITTFVTFAMVSGYFGWIGEASCGCFGAIHASPWHAFAVDVFALVLLGLGRPDFRQMRLSSRSDSVRLLPIAAGLVAGSTVVIGIVLGGATFAYGSLDAALARLRGEAVTVSPSYVDFGDGATGEVLKATIEVRNWTGETVRLVGGTSDCSCITTNDLPISVPAGGAATVTIQLRVRAANAGIMTRTAELWTDCKQQRAIPLLIACRVK